MSEQTILEESIEQDFEKYITHLGKLGFSKYDEDQYQETYLKKDPAGRKLYVRIGKLTHTAEINRGYVEIIMDSTSEHSCPAKDSLENKLFWHVLNGLGYSACDTKLDGKKSSSVDFLDRKWLSRISRPGNHNLLKIGRDDMEHVQEDITFIAGLFDSMYDVTSKAYQQIEKILENNKPPQLPEQRETVWLVSGCWDPTD